MPTLAPQVIAAIVTGVFAIGAAVVAYFLNRRLKVMELDFQKARDDLAHARKMEEETKRVAKLPGDVPAAFAQEALYIQALRVFRQDFVTRLTFRERTPGALELEVEISFTVMNLTPNAYEFPHQVGVVPDQEEDITRILRVSATGADLGAEYDESFADAAKPSLEFSRKVKVSPNGKAPKNRFESRFRRVVRPIDTEVIFFVQPTLDAEVRVESKPADLHVTVEFSHRDSDSAVVLPVPPASPIRWRLDRASLPWQSLVIRWHKKSPTQPDATRGSPTTG